MSIIKREISIKFNELLAKYPIVTLLGPRQSGKTTLATSLKADYQYISLEDHEIRLFAEQDPKGLIKRYAGKLIIDEIQHVPTLLSHLQTLVDSQQQNGQFIITGSHQLALTEAISQSLAGRTAILELLPFNYNEIQHYQPDLSEDALMLHGGFPRIYNQKLDPTQAYKDYVKTYLERDVRQMINLKDLLVFQRFLKLCAARTACELNMNSLANEVGVSHHTIKHWLSILQASYLIHLVMPYYENFGKQVVKTPKLYFSDVGLVSYLLEIETPQQLSRDPLRGQLFETFIYTELAKARFNQGKEANLYYYRDSQRHEVDLIFKRGSELVAIEIKSSHTIQKNHFKGLNYFQSLVGERCQKSFLIYAGEQDIMLDNTAILNFKQCHQVFNDSL